MIIYKFPSPSTLEDNICVMGFFNIQKQLNKKKSETVTLLCDSLYLLK